MTKEDKILVCGVFEALLEKPYNELNTFLGSITIDEMGKLYSNLRKELFGDNYEN